MITVLHNIINRLLIANWTDTPIAWDNTEFTPMRGVPYINPRLTTVSAEQASITGLIKTTNTLTIGIYVPTTKGSRHGAYLGGLLAELFRGYYEDYAEFLAPRLLRQGQIEEWFKWELSVPINYDDCST